jgi:hypothetical protein
VAVSPSLSRLVVMEAKRSSDPSHGSRGTGETVAYKGGGVSSETVGKTPEFVSVWQLSQIAIPLLAWCCRRPLPKPSEMVSSPASPSCPWHPTQPVALGKVGLDSWAGNPPWHGLQPKTPLRCASCSGSLVPGPKMGWHNWQLSLVPLAPKSKKAPAFGAQRAKAIRVATQHQLHATFLMTPPLSADVFEAALPAPRNDVMLITSSCSF